MSKTFLVLLSWVWAGRLDSVVGVGRLLRLGHKRHYGLLPAVLSLVDLAALSQGHSGSLLERSAWQGTEASGSRPCEEASLEADPPASDQPSDDCTPIPSLDCNLMSPFEPKPPSYAAPKFLAYRNCKVIKLIHVIHGSYVLKSHWEHWIVKYWTIAPRENIVRFLQNSGHTVIKWSIHNLVLCVFLFKDTLFNVYCWFINIESMMANSTITHIWTKFI